MLFVSRYVVNDHSLQASPYTSLQNQFKKTVYIYIYKKDTKIFTQISELLYILGYNYEIYLHF